jgi:ribonuclease HI
MWRVFLERGGERTAVFLPLLLLRAGDVEKNPGPGVCKACNVAFRGGQVPLTCGKCGGSYHVVEKCSGVKRSASDKLRKDGGNWDCKKCKDGKEEKDDEVRTQGTNGEELKEICKECKRKMKAARIITICKECHGYYHNSCAKVTRAQLEGEVSRGIWVCEKCMKTEKLVKIRGEMKAGDGKEQLKQGGKMVGERKDGLRILQWNADGIWNKARELEEMMYRWKIDIAMVQESKLRENQKTPTFRGYTVIRKDRELIRKDEDRKGGGLLTIIREDIVYGVVDDWRGLCTEGLKVRIHLKEEEVVQMTNVYRPPIRNTKEDKRKQDPISKWIEGGENNIIAGDFNLHSPEWGSNGNSGEEVAFLQEWCEKENFVVANDKSYTHVDRSNGAKSVPDLTLVHVKLKERMSWRTLDEMGSDHRPILMVLMGDRKTREKRKRVTWAWRKADWEKFRKLMEGKVEKMEGETLTDMIKEMQTAMLQAARESIPKKKAADSNRPYWTPELTEMANKRMELRREGNKMEEWKEMNEKMKEKLEEERRIFWKEYVKKLEEEKDVAKVWKTIKCLNEGVKGQKMNETLVVNGKELRTDKEKAESFIQQYAAVNDIGINKEDRRRKVKIKKRWRQYGNEEMVEYEKEFTRGEMEHALKQMAENKKGGCDGIEPAMVKNLPEAGRARLLIIFNESWRRKQVPGSWKKAQIIPLLKEGKDPNTRDSFRPVSLTPVLVKILERMVVNRTMYWMEKKKIINPWQAGFQRCHATEDQIIRMCQEIQDGLERKPHSRTLAIAIDCTKAYDRVWKGRLLERMMDEGMPRALISWFMEFLEDRKGQVRFGDAKSKWRMMKEGLPQGAVSSPVLFLLYVNDWKDFVEEGVRYSGFADDVAVWIQGNRLEEVKGRAERALRKIEQWAERNKITLNPTKTEACVYTNNIRERSWNPGLVLGGKDIGMKKEIKLLGVMVDQAMAFKGQTKKVVESVKKRSRVLRVLAGRSWGWSIEALLRVYKVVVESVVWYGAAGWMPWLAKTSLDKLEVAQREALRAVTGMAKSVAAGYIYLETGVTPISWEGKRRAVMAYEKSMRLEEDNPRRMVMEKSERTRLKKNRGLREQAKCESEKVLGRHARRKMAQCRERPWRMLMDTTVRIETSMKEPIKKEMTSEEKRRISQDTQGQYGDMEIEIYTDGSAAEGHSDGGSAAICWRGGEEEVLMEAAGTWCSSFISEVKAMRLAIRKIVEDGPRSAVVYTDSQALLRSLQNGKTHTSMDLESLKKELIDASEKSKVVLQWIPSHVGTLGNERADSMANVARSLDQEDVELEWESVRSAVKRRMKFVPEMDDRMKEVYGSGIKRAECGRNSSVLLAQLRSGHCIKTRYYRKRIGVEESGECSDCGEEEDKDHVFGCERWRKEREELKVGGKSVLRSEATALRYLHRVKPLWF